MPLFNFKCDNCGRTKRVISDIAPETFYCDPDHGKNPYGTCGGVYERAYEGPTQKVTEIKDNGYMPKRIEQLQDMEGLLQERNNASKKG